MTDALRLILELGKTRRVVAGATDWPGLDRWGTSEPDAIDTIVTYLPRYATVAERAGLRTTFDLASGLEVVERVTGSSSTDFWGVAHVPSDLEREVLPDGALERRLALLQACWAEFDLVASRINGELRPGARSAGRSREEIVRHVLETEPGQFSRKLEVRTPPEAMATKAGLAGHRQAFLDAMRVANAEGRQARTWPIQFLIRRVANHVMDHAWEIEDRDPASRAAP